MSTKSALTGIRIVDMSRVLGGPFCTQILADHGADVIKVEPPQGDETRDWGPPYNANGISAYFSGVNRNKRSIAIDVRQEAGREALLRLLEDADVLIENFKTGTLEKWGLGYEEVLKRRFPRLIHCRVTGFGADGPFGGFPGYDAVAQAWTGLISVNGSEESGPVRLGIPLVDLATGLNGVIGILMAMAEREKSGEGQSVEVSLFDTGVQLQHPHSANYFASGKAPKLTGNAHPNIAPYDLYKTKGQSVFLGIGNNRQFRRMCEILGRPELGDDRRFATNGDRIENRAALTREIETAMAEFDGAEIAARMLEAGVPAGAALTVPEVMSHPHTLHRRMVVEKDGYQGTGLAIKLSRTPGEVRNPPPQFADSTEAVLTESGFSPEEIEELIASGIVIKERQTG